MHLSEFDVDLHDRLLINQQKVPTVTETKKPNLVFFEAGLYSRCTAPQALIDGPL
jgi:hypothetical protein